MRLFIQILPWLLGAMATPVFGQIQITTNPPLPVAVVGLAYNQTINTSAMVNVTCQLASGTPPSGIVLGQSGTGCTLTGTPTAAGSYTFTVQASIPGPQSDSRTYTLTVVNPLQITTAALPAAIVGSPYNFTVAASGGSGNYNWSVTGLTGSNIVLTAASGNLSGTPTATGSYTLNLSVSDTTYPNPPIVPATRTLTLLISDLAITTASPLPNGTVGVAYSQALAASGGTGPYTFSLQSGSLPAGLNLVNGVITGTPTAAGTSNFTVQVTDNVGTVVSKALSLTVTGAALSITTASPLPNGTVGVAYSQALAATGGTGPYTFSLQSGSSLPAGLNLVNGVITGTPTAAVTAASFTIVVTDSASATANKTFNLTIAPPPLSITTSSLPNWTVNRPYNQTIAATGGTGPYTWGLATGSNPLPANLSITPSTGVLSGTPTVTGTFSFTVQVTDSASTSATRNFSISIASAPAITTTSLPNGSVGVAYSATVAVSNGTSPFTFSQAGGTLPGGLTLNTSTGAITGSPTTNGSFTFSIQATDAAGATTAAQSYTVQIGTTLSVTTTSLPNGAVGTAYNQTLAATGGSGTGYTWSLVSGQGNLPNGLTLSTAGVISGTPTAAGTSNFTVQVTDSASATATRALAITVSGPAVTITTASPLPQGVVGSSYSVALAATGGSGTGYSFSASGGTLPPGITLSTAGLLSGLPTTGGSYSFTIGVQDSLGGIGQKAFTLFIATSALTISTNSALPGATVGAAYSTALQASGGSGSGYVFSIASGTLPAGLSLSTNGVIAGTATAAGTANFTVQVTDNAGGVATKPFVLSATVANLVITTTSLPTALVNTTYSASLSATGGQTPYSWSIISGLLPTGISFDLNTGLLSGTPTQLGTFNLRFRVQDANGLNTTADLTLQVATFSITTNSLPSGSVGQAYSAQLQVIGGAAPITFLLASGTTLPPGLTLNANTGLITGIPSTSGNFNLAFQARDATNATTPVKALVLGIASNIAITTTSPLPPATIGTPYSVTLAATGGTGSYTWAVTNGALPVGLTLGGGTGRISGLPSQPAGSFNFVIQVTDTLNGTAERQFTIVVGSGLSITNTSLPNPSPGVLYQQLLQVTGGTAPYVWSLVPGSGSLPTGINLLSNGQITGTTSQQGTFTFTVQVADVNGLTAQRQFSFQVGNQLAINTASLSNGVIGTAYNALLTASGGTGTGYVWSVSTGTLPLGLSLNAVSGLLAGTPAGPAGTSTFTVQVTDSGGNVATRQLSLTITASSTLTITTPAVPNGTVGTPYPTTTLTASGGSGTGYTWTVLSGAIPGLTLSSTGVLSGTPTTAGNYNLTVQVRDSLNATASQLYAVTIALTAALAIDTQTLPGGSLNVPYSATISASGGAGGYVFTVVSGSGLLPTGLNLATNGSLTGTPTAAGTFNFTVRVTDAQSNSAQRAYSITIASGLSITNAETLPAATPNVVYSVTLLAAGGSAPYTWTVIQGLLPGGLTLNATTGVLAGTPTTPGTFQFTIRVQDVLSATASKAFTLVVGASGVTITTTDPLPVATIGAVYTTQLLATGGTAPYTWSIIAGTLPAGLTLGATTGVISGTATAAASAAITVRVQDATGAFTTKNFTLVVAASAVTIINADPLPAATLAAAYSTQFAATGGTAPYTWSITSGILPTGLTLSTSGLLSGTPTVAGSVTITVRVQDANGLFATKNFTLAVSGGTLTITNAATLPGGATNVPYNLQLSATGGVAPYLWSITQGLLPDGLGLIPATGIISGTPSTPGTSVFTIQVRDAGGVTFSRQFTIVIGGSGLSIATTTLPGGFVGTFYTQTLQATGGTAPYSWTSEGTVPPGLGLTQAGVLFGTPTAPGTYNFVVRAQDAGGATATRSLAVTIGGSGLTITTTALPGASLGTAYSATLQASGGTGQLTWTLTAGQLPPGIGLTNSTGVLAGTPTVPGNYTFTVRVNDAASGTATREFALTVNSGLTITTTALPGGSVGQAYTQTLTAAGGTGTGYVWSITVGSLPAGLTLSPTGAITGTPTANGTSNFTVQVVDSGLASATKPLSITIGSTLAIVTQTLPNGQLGVAYSQVVTAAGGTGALQWTLVGSLPPGLSLNASTGAITGTPTQNGIFNFTLRVQDAANSAQRQFTIVVGESFSITTPTALANATEGVAYSQALAASGGQAPYTWTLSVGTLPAGLSLTPSSGLISGTPTAAGSYSFIVQVADAAQQTATKAFTMVVTGRLAIVTSAQLPIGTVRVAYRETLTASGGVAPYTWSLLNGALPIGVTLTTAGELSGTPTNAGLFTFTAQVTDRANATATRAFTLNIALGLSITTTSPLPAATAGQAYVQTISATGGLAPYTFTVSAGALPTGLTLNSQGILAGAPTAAGTFNFTVQVTDANRSTATAAMAVTIRLPATPAVLLSGLSETVEPAQQPRLTVSLGAPYPVPITGTLTLTFTSDATVPLDDPAVVFTNGRRTVDFTIPANTTAAQLPAGFAMQTGTVSGAIRLAVSNLRTGDQSIMPDPEPSITARLAKGAPVMRQVVARRVASGLEVQVTGYATSREITQALFRFTPAPGSTLQTTELTVQLGDGARTWYQSEQSRAFGSQFTLTQQFNVQGDTSAISSVTVTLTNAQGTSPAATANFQ
jgi:hypothetical protein